MKDVHGRRKSGGPVCKVKMTDLSREPSESKENLQIESVVKKTLW